MDAIDAVAAIDARVEEMAAPIAHAVERLDQIPGINITNACVILAEVGTDMSRFPTAGHLVSWAKFAPAPENPPGRRKASR